MPEISIIVPVYINEALINTAWTVRELLDVIPSCEKEIGYCFVVCFWMSKSPKQIEFGSMFVRIIPMNAE